MIENSKNYNDILKNLKKEKEPEKDNLESSTIGGLAKEIIEELGIDENSDKQPSMADLGNMMSTTFSKINSKISSGEFNHEQLMKEAQDMMGGLDLFGGQNNNNNNNKMPRGMAGMPKDINVPNRKVVRRKKKKNSQKKIETNDNKLSGQSLNEKSVANDTSVVNETTDDS